MDLNEKILSKASEMFLSFGVKYVTMDALSGELGISKRTLYEHFRDKDDLVIQCVRYMLLKDNEQLLEIIDASEHVIEALFNILRYQEGRRKHFPKVFLEDIKKYYEQVNATFYSCREDLKKFSASFVLIDKGMKQGIFRKELRTELVDTFLHETISMLHQSNRIHMLKPEPKEVLHTIFLPYFRGISTAKGLALLETYFSENHQ
jgi:AcrR family transcriptional regulator